MQDADAIERRLSAVERAISDGETDGSLELATDHDPRVAGLEERLASLESAVADLEAATKALRGYVGNVRSVNRDVERRAEAALAAVDRLERHLDDRELESSPTPETRVDTGDAADGISAETPESAEEGRGADGASGADRQRGLDGIECGPEMPVPDARGQATASNGEAGRDPDRAARAEPGEDRTAEPDDGGLIDRVRDTL